MLKKLITAALLLSSPAAFSPRSPAQNAPAAPLAINTESLPEAVPLRTYSVRLSASGGTPVLHWSVIRGELPPGIELQDDGTISGLPKTAGKFRFTAEVTDSAQPPNHLHRQFTLVVITPLTIDWSRAPSVQADNIEGAVKITNGTGDSFDLTVIVVAVNEIGKAFALGYQRLELKGGTADFQVPFASTLPVGAYVVHADAVAELPAQNVIYRKRLQTPAPLQITIGP